MKDAVDVRRGAHKLVGPKIVLRVANEFDKSDQNAPRMRLQKNQPFHENTCDLLLNMTMSVPLRLMELAKKKKEYRARMMSVSIRKSELICKSRKQLKAAFRVQVHREINK